MHLVPRLTPQAQEELEAVLTIVNNTSLADRPDTRHCFLADHTGNFQTSTLYNLLKGSLGHDDVSTTFIWGNKAPPRAQFFCWLLMQGKIQCKWNLKKKGLWMMTVVKYVTKTVKLLRTSSSTARLHANFGAPSDSLSLMIWAPRTCQTSVALIAFRVQNSTPLSSSGAGNCGNTEMVSSFVRIMPLLRPLYIHALLKQKLGRTGTTGKRHKY